MDVFWIIFISGVFVAACQIIISNSDVKNSDPTIPWPQNVKPQGWIFYLLTIVLMILPAIQYAVQEKYIAEKEKDTYAAQEVRDEKLRIRYDSSLYEMKKKFDTTTAIVSQTLGIYGFALDATNKVLINLRDSVSTIGTNRIDPILGFKGIKLLDSINNQYKLEISVESRDAGSSFFDVKTDVVVQDDIGNYYFINKFETFPLIPHGTKLSTNGSLYTKRGIYINANVSKFFIWFRGNYKSIDGIKSYRINEIYIFARSDRSLTQVSKPDLKKTITNLILQNRN